MNNKKYEDLLSFIYELAHDEGEGHLNDLNRKQLLDHIIYEAETYMDDPSEHTPNMPRKSG